MRSPSHATLPDPGSVVLIAAASGRALAASARRAGYRPLVADFFDDSDTGELAIASCGIEGGLESGFTQESLFAALEKLEARAEPCGLVYGAGFEDRVGLLEALAERWSLLGNPPEVVRRVKDPETLATLCFFLDIPHPEVRRTKPEACAGWLAKAVGGSGGTHVTPASEAREDDEDIYFQREVPGDPVSILLVADGSDARVIGASRQWPAPAPDEPYRFGGSLRPAGLSAGLQRRIAEIGRSLARAAGLRGLGSVDFLVDGDNVTLIEINPRPGATLDIFDDCDGRLFEAHLEGCRGRLPTEPLEFSGAAAAGIAYARREIEVMPVLDWPDWAADREKPGGRLQAGAPVCTIEARAEDPVRARAILEQRTVTILDRIEQQEREWRLEHQ